MPVTVLGIRHHGPGSARGVRDALAALRPDCVLVEGPPDGDAALPFAADPGLAPPVALLVYSTADPARAASWPFAAFSPEWQAIRYAAEAAVPVRFVDLPVAQWLALEPERTTPLRRDPIGWLAEAAGYDDPEQWWEDVVEHRAGPAPFAAVADAMRALREDLPPERGLEARREAAMRRGIRQAVRGGAEHVAVVCGAWHVPALDRLPPAAHDAALLKGLKKVKVTATWVPWSHGRLAAGTGYGAGVASPGWYAHLFAAEQDAVTRWVVRVARLLRGEDLDASSAAVVDTVRAAEVLAALRGRPLAGLPEIDDAVRAVLCGGSDVPMALVRERLVVGEALGTVPASAPQVPLAADLAALQRRLRLKPAAEARRLDLDLRRPLDADRSGLLHRLDLLDVPWGVVIADDRGTGTFREAWELRWRPELAVRVVVAAGWGTTVEAAAGARVRELAGAADLPGLTALLERALPADLPGALAAVTDALGRRAALDADVAHLMDALPPLARVVRYGDVRGTAPGTVRAVVDGLVARICVGVPGAFAALDDEAAGRALRRLAAVGSAIALLDRADLRAAWHATLRVLADRRGVHGLLAGRACRVLADAGVLGGDDVRRRAARALSVGVEPDRAAAWAEGFLADSGLVLLADEALLALLDDWIAGIPGDRFAEALPLLRRTFATFPAGERRRIGEAAAALRARGGRPAAQDEDDVDPERAARVLPVLARLTGGTA